MLKGREDPAWEVKKVGDYIIPSLILGDPTHDEVLGEQRKLMDELIAKSSQQQQSNVNNSTKSKRSLLPHRLR